MGIQVSLLQPFRLKLIPMFTALPVSFDCSVQNQIPSIGFFSFQIEHGYSHTKFTLSTRYLVELVFEECKDVFFVLWIYYYDCFAIAKRVL